MAKIAVVGAGAFGTALAIYSRKIGHDVTVWCFEKDLPDLVTSTGENSIYLPGITVDSSITWTTDPDQAVTNADLVLLVAPSAYIRTTAKLIADKI